MFRSRLSGRVGVTRCLILAAMCAVLAVGLSTRAAGQRDNSKHRVRLIIDYNDGVQKHFTAIPWSKQMTVLDAMNLARKSPHGITFSIRGEGSTALLTKIDDLANQGGAREGRNWLYWVNTEFADKSLGAQALEPADVVLWRFDKWSNR